VQLARHTGNRERPMKKPARKNRTSILLIVVFLVGLSVLLYPSISNYWNQFHASHAISKYEQTVSHLDENRKKQMLTVARRYNDLLRGGEDQHHMTAAQQKEYNSLLNADGTGVMGYVDIPKIHVSLPVYHGTSDAVLAAGAGHLQGSSLPVGGTGTHAVITGHRGLPSAKLFTDLDKMQAGDTFSLTVLGETLYYKVDQIKIVLPSEVGSLTIDPKKDYVTLITCTPYGINTHRLLVRGVRTNGPNTVNAAADAVQIDPMLVAPVVAAPILLVLLIMLLTSTARKRRDKGTPNFGKDESKK